jgi:hypothetical protein
MQTPPRPSLPGTWLQTPAGNPPLPAPSSWALVSRNADPPYTHGRVEPANLGITRADQNSGVQQQQQSVAESSRPSKSRNPDVRAARAVNEALEGESRFPELDAYLSRKFSNPSLYQHALMVPQMATLLSMTYSPLRLGRPFRRCGFTISPIRYLSNTTERLLLRAWDYLRR